MFLQEYFKCPYEEKCKMDVSNRRFCKRCRLRKCFEIGMRKEYILTEEEKLRKRQRIEENRLIQCVIVLIDGSRAGQLNSPHAPVLQSPQRITKLVSYTL